MLNQYLSHLPALNILFWFKQDVEIAHLIVQPNLYIYILSYFIFLQVTHYIYIIVLYFQAGQATEPESMISLSMISQTDGQVGSRVNRRHTLVTRTSRTQ